MSGTVLLWQLIALNTCLSLYSFDKFSTFNLAKRIILILFNCLMKFTRFSILCHYTLGFPSPEILVFLVSISDVTVSEPKIKSWKNATKMEHIHLSFSANNICPGKTFWKLSKHWNVITFRTTADTVHVHVPVARIRKPSKQLGCLHFYTLQFAYISQRFVFCSSQSPVTISGYATNWTGTSWEEIYPQQNKLSADFWRAISWCQ